MRGGSRPVDEQLWSDQRPPSREDRSTRPVKKKLVVSQFAVHAGAAAMPQVGIGTYPTLRAPVRQPLVGLMDPRPSQG